MAKSDGQLLVVRRAITLVNGDVVVDTGLCQLNLGVTPPLDGSDTVPSRVMVVPMAPLADWAGVTHGEPFIASGTVQVVFHGVGATVVNVMFLAPAEFMGPIDVDHVYEIEAADCNSFTVITYDNLSVQPPNIQE
jgi:hypothetical protein